MKTALNSISHVLKGWGWKLIFLLTGALILTGCFGAGMYQSPKNKPLSSSGFFADGSSARPLVPGSVVAGQAPAADPVLSGKGPDGKDVTDIPLPVTVELMQRGQQRFDIYCAPCHGYTGEGNGVIIPHGMPAPPSLNSDALHNATAGFIFDVITNGYGRMLSYGYRVKPDDRWAIVAYIRAMQLSQDANPQNLTPEERQKLESQP